MTGVSEPLRTLLYAKAKQAACAGAGIDFEVDTLFLAGGANKVEPQSVTFTFSSLRIGARQVRQFIGRQPTAIVSDLETDPIACVTR